MIASIVIFANKDITKGEFQKQMKNLKWIIGLVILVIVGYTIFNGSESAPKQDNAAYTQQLQNARKRMNFSKQEKTLLSKIKQLSKDYRILR
jgi:uncharacterized membrane-anchored protein YhcB (DUF1043 family)